MELAKIRTKARQEQDRIPEPAACPAGPAPEAPLIVAAPCTAEPVVEQAGELVLTGSAGAVSPAPSVRFDPLGVILAGRQLDQAQCSSDDQVEEGAAAVQESDAYQEFLCFMLGREEYGINIMEIKELIKPRELTEVPRAPHFVDGIISLRGVIVPVLDLRKRLGLGLPAGATAQRVVIVRCASGLSGLLVDRVTGVVRIADQWREPTPAALEGIDRDFVAGIGRSDDRMVILLDVRHVADIGLHGEA